MEQHKWTESNNWHNFHFVMYCFNENHVNSMHTHRHTIHSIVFANRNEALHWISNERHNIVFNNVNSKKNNNNKELVVCFADFYRTHIICDWCVCTAPYCTRTVFRRFSSIPIFGSNWFNFPKSFSESAMRPIVPKLIQVARKFNGERKMWNDKCQTSRFDKIFRFHC